MSKSHILYLRIPEEDWQAVLNEAQKTQTSLVRAAIRLLQAGIETKQDPPDVPPSA